MIAIYDMPIGFIFEEPNKCKCIYEDRDLEIAKKKCAAINVKFSTTDYEVRRVDITDIGGTDCPTPSKEATHDEQR